MKRFLKFDTAEDKIKSLLRLLGIIVVIIILKGMYNEKYQINQNGILVPLFLIASGAFSLIYFADAFSKGSIVRVWAATIIFNFLFNIIKENTKKNNTEAEKITIRIFGIFVLCGWLALYLICTYSKT